MKSPGNWQMNQTITISPAYPAIACSETSNRSWCRCGAGRGLCWEWRSCEELALIIRCLPAHGWEQRGQSSRMVKCWLRTHQDSTATVEALVGVPHGQHMHSHNPPCPKACLYTTHESYASWDRETVWPYSRSWHCSSWFKIQVQWIRACSCPALFTGSNSVICRIGWTCLKCGWVHFKKGPINFQKENGHTHCILCLYCPIAICSHTVASKKPLCVMLCRWWQPYYSIAVSQSYWPLWRCCWRK